MNLEKISAVFQNCKRFGKGDLVSKDARIRTFLRKRSSAETLPWDGIIAGIGSFHGEGRT